MLKACQTNVPTLGHRRVTHRLGRLGRAELYFNRQYRQYEVRDNDSVLNLIPTRKPWHTSGYLADDESDDSSDSSDSSDSDDEDSLEDCSDDYTFHRPAYRHIVLDHCDQTS
eukprot:COSAG02_NODE_12413_length_1550_cov_1.346657_1_plen_112_part_00